MSAKIRAKPSSIAYRRRPALPKLNAKRVVSRIRTEIVPMLDDLRRSAAEGGNDRAELEFRVLSTVRKIRLNLDSVLSQQESETRRP